MILIRDINCILDIVHCCFPKECVCFSVCIMPAAGHMSYAHFHILNIYLLCIYRNIHKRRMYEIIFFLLCRQCSECDQAVKWVDMEAEMAMETLPDGTKRPRRQIKEPVKFVPQDSPMNPRRFHKKHNTP